MPEKLVGTNDTTGDLVGKVTGRAKHAEDCRADGLNTLALSIPDPETLEAGRRVHEPLTVHV